MTELRIAKRVIKELLNKLKIKEIENNYLEGCVSEQELYQATHDCKRSPDTFNKHELEQIVKTVMKLTGNRCLTADDISELINVNKSDILQVME
jgi:hypothetical protein